MIYENFEIINKKYLNSIININEINNITSECYINNQKIIINLPNSLNEKKYISIIGFFDENKIFIKEYYFIYYDLDERKEHFEFILKDLKNILTEINNNDSKKLIYKGKIIGTIVKLNKKTINDNKYPVIKKVIENPFIKFNFKCCPNYGLQNIGATCYMNATLQCFCHIEKFINYFKYNNNLIKKVENKKEYLSYSFKLLIENLWPDDLSLNKKKYFAPEEFKEKISKLNPLFKGIAANDAKDLVNFIIMTLHKELNKAKINPEVIDDDAEIDQTKKNLVFDNFKNEFISKNQSFISDLFYAMNGSITECYNCHVKLYNYQIYFFIVFPLEEVRKFKIECNMQNQFNFYNNFYFNNNYFNNNEVNIYDCFDYDKKVNIMSGENAMYCNRCKIQTHCGMNNYLVTGPEILILLLNRGKGIEFNVKIHFFEDLNLYNYIEYKETGTNYKLIGVITHIGESSMDGHFIAYCKDPITNLWFKYNDAFVNDVENFKAEVIDFAMPYLLFYQKVINI